MIEEDVNVRCSTKKTPVKKAGSIKVEPGLVNADKPSTSATVSKQKVKVEESEEDFTFDEPPLKKIKTGCPQEKCVKYVAGDKLNGDHKMNWDIVEVCNALLFTTKLTYLNCRRKLSRVKLHVHFISDVYNTSSGCIPKSVSLPLFL